MGIHWAFTALCSVLTFAILLSLVRWIGETQISQATYFNWVAGACMGNVAANMLSADNFRSVAVSAVQLFFFAVVTIIASWLAVKSRRFREVASGKPVMLVHNGQHLFDNMKRTKVDSDLLKQMLREQGYFDYKDIKYAILEPNGSLSVLPQNKTSDAQISDDAAQIKNPSAQKRKESQNTK